MKQRNAKERLIAPLLALILALGLAACAGQGATGQSATDDAASEAVEGTATDDAASEATEEAPTDESSTSQKTADEVVEPGGEPWANTTWSTGVPDEKPSEKDDLYLAVDYDWLKEAKEVGNPASRSMMPTPDIRNAAMTAIADSTAQGNGLRQLRLFYKQATHLKTLHKIGGSEIQPYLDRIMQTQSLSELEAVLLSEDFPFDPWFKMGVSFADKRENNIAFIAPNMLFSEIESDSGDPYQDWEDDPDQRQAAQQVVDAYTKNFAGGLTLVGIEADKTLDTAHEIFEFEKRYGKALVTNAEVNTGTYGEHAGEPTAFSMDELEKTFKDFPLRALVAKEGKGTSESFYLDDLKWATAFGELWTEDNFEMIRLTSAARIIKECKPYLDPAIYTLPDEESALTNDQETDPADEAIEFAYAACDSSDTFGDIIAQNYVENTLGQDTVDRLTKLSEDLVETYRTLVSETSWLDETSRANVLDKLDNMTLNILVPDEGYTDYSGLKLKSTKRGGSLFTNYLRIKAYHEQAENARIGQPACARIVWEIINPTVMNAFYDPSSNSINILPGYLTNTIYSDSMSDEEVLAKVGATIAHEMSHGFDYSGSQYDAYGLQQPIFSEGDVDDYLQRRNKLADYYSTISYNTEGDKVHGEEKCVEAAADLCGVQVVCAYAQELDGFDYKRFFEEYAELWGTTYPARFASRAIADSHPLYYLRTNVNAQMQDEFYEAFDVDADDGMYLAPEARVAFWGEAA